MFDQFNLEWGPSRSCAQYNRRVHPDTLNRLLIRYQSVGGRPHRPITVEFTPCDGVSTLPAEHAAMRIRFGASWFPLGRCDRLLAQTVEPVGGCL